MNPSSSLALERLRSESLVRTRSQVKTELSRAASVIDDGIFCLERMRSRGSVSCALRSEDSDTPGTRRSPRLLERVVSRGLSNSLLERAGSEVPVISSGSALPSLLQPMSSEVSLQASMSGQAFDDLDNAMGPIELAKKLGKQSASEVQPPTVEQSSAAGARAETASFLVDTATLHLSKPPDSEYFCLKNKKRKKPSGPALGIRKIANHFHEDTSSYKAFINEPCKNCGAVEFDDTKPGTRTCMRCRFQMETCTNCSAADFFVDEKAGTRTCRRCGVQIEERIERDLYKGQGKVLDYHRATIPDDEEPDNIFIEALACSKGRAKTLRNSLRNTRDKLHSVANAMDLDEELAGHVVRTAMKYFKMLLKKDINFKGKNMNAVHAALFWYALLMCDSYRHNPPKRAYKAVRIPANKALPQSDRFQPIKDSELRKFAEWLQKSTAAGGAGLPKLPASSRPVPQQLVEDLLLRLKGPDVHEDLRLDDKTFRLALSNYQQLRPDLFRTVNDRSGARVVIGGFGTGRFPHGVAAAVVWVCGAHRKYSCDNLAETLKYQCRIESSVTAGTIRQISNELCTTLEDIRLASPASKVAAVIESLDLGSISNKTSRSNFAKRIKIDTRPANVGEPK